jgi:hypothetical protein
MLLSTSIYPQKEHWPPVNALCSPRRRSRAIFAIRMRWRKARQVRAFRHGRVIKGAKRRRGKKRVDLLKQNIPSTICRDGGNP